MLIRKVSNLSFNLLLLYSFKTCQEAEILHEKQNTSNRGNKSVRMYGANLSQAWEVISNFQDKKKETCSVFCLENWKSLLRLVRGLRRFLF